MSKSTLTCFSMGVLFLVAGIANADSFTCEGRGYRVKLAHYNDPASGTRNAAAFIVSNRSGSLLRAFGDEIERVSTHDAVIYEAHVNSADTGRFIFGALEIFRDEEGTIWKSDRYRARLILNTDRAKHRVSLQCRRHTRN